MSPINILPKPMAFLKIAIVILITNGFGNSFLGAQTTPATVLWQQALGGSAADAAYSVRLAPGKMIAVAGSTRSNDGMLATLKPSLDLDAWLVKLNLSGTILWQQHYGGTYNDEARDLKILPDGGYILAGWTESPELTKGGRDVYIVRTDGLGGKLWQKTYGGSGNDNASVILPLPDGGFLVAGETGSVGGNIAKNAGGLDGWLLRLEANGNLRWEKTYGGKNNEVISAAARTADGQFILVGSSDSNDGDITGNKGKMDLFVMKVDEGGNLIWRRNYGGTSFDEGHAVTIAPDGRIYIAGTTFSNDGDVSGNHGGGDVWILCLDGYGTLQWNRCLGGAWDEGANSIEVRKNGQLVIGATSRSRDGDRAVAKGVFDGWLIITDSFGKLLWEKTAGGFENDAFTAATELPGGDFIAVGYTGSKDGDLAGINVFGSNDFWCVAIQPPLTAAAKPVAKSESATIISGYVIDKKTRAKLKAEVTVNDNVTKKRVASARTDSTGLFQLILNKTQGLTLGAVSEGYLLLATNLQVSADEIGTEIIRELALEPVQKDQVLNLFHVYFEVGSAVMRPEAKLELERLASFMIANAGVKIKINGHTDNTGDAKSKTVLSQYRAQAVKSFLMDRGIYEGRMTTEGFGLTRPIAPNNTEENRALNRRVEIVITAIQ